MYQQDSFKIFVSIRKDIQSDIEYKKLILMVQGKLSCLIRYLAKVQLN